MSIRVQLAPGLCALRTVLGKLPFACLRRSPRRNVAMLLDQIESAREGLSEFGQMSDQEFSSLAQGLSRLNARLIELRRLTASLEAKLEDRDDDRAISSAYALYKDSVDLVHSNAGIAVSAHERLTQVEAALIRSCRGQEAFQRDHMFLRIVTLGIRIEVSRLPSEAQAVFLNVASAIAETGERIHNCTATAFARIEAVIEESRAARGALTQSEGDLHAKARHSVDTLQQELTALQTALVPCSTESRAIGELLAVAQPQTLGVIAALQHQDIVRQQLEHVSEGFQDLDQHLRAAHEPVAGQPDVEWDYVHHAARIQAAQLGASRAEIEHAGTAVVGGLQSLLDTSAAMVTRFSAMETAAAAALDDCHIAELFSKELHALTGVIERSQQANARTDRLVGRIGEVVRVFSEEINRYELDVKIVALNAQIAAAHLPYANALSKLAQETSAVSDANAQLTRQLSADLHASLEKLDQLQREGAEFLAIVSREKAQLEQGLAIVIEKLARLVQHVRAGAMQARRDITPVHADCRALLDGLGFPALIERTFGPAVELCDDLSAGSGPVSAGAPSQSAQMKIQQHRSRYTMSKEDATHAAALACTAVTAVRETGADSIELFDEPAAPPVPLVPPVVSVTTEPPITASTGTDARQSAPTEPVKSDFGDGIDLF